MLSFLIKIGIFDEIDSINNTDSRISDVIFFNYNNSSSITKKKVKIFGAKIR
jgi:hypothetical protein